MEASARCESRATGGARKKKKKNNAYPPTSVQAIPAFIYDRGYPIAIGYLMSSNHEMVLDNKMAVVSSFSVD